MPSTFSAIVTSSLESSTTAGVEPTLVRVDKSFNRVLSAHARLVSVYVCKLYSAENPSFQHRPTRHLRFLCRTISVALWLTVKVALGIAF
jgi:hypothetical protein